MRSKFNFQKIIKNMPAFIAGVFCWILLWIFTGSSCFIRATFGIPCPGCGSTRAVFALFHGDIREALAFHPLVFLTLALIAAYIFTLVFNISIFDSTKYKYITVFMWCIFAIYVSVYIIRMILLYPDTEPMTYLDTSILGRIIGFVKNII